MLVNWNGSEFTVPCIRSLLLGSVRPDKIVVVDNASADDSIPRISAEFPDTVFIKNTENRGFAAANNQGIKLLLDSGADFVWILNNDTVVSGDCLKNLIAAADSYPQIAGFSGKIFRDSGPELLWYAGAYRHPLHAAPKHILQATLDPQAVNGGVEVPFISGCCMFIPSWGLRKHGGFIEKYIAYYEDSEWCWRATNSGAKLCYVPDAALTHKVSASVKKNNKSADTLWFVRYLMNRNQLWTVRLRAKNIPHKIVFLAFNILIQVRDIISYICRGQLKNALLMCRSLCAGLFQAVPEDLPVWD